LVTMLFGPALDEGFTTMAEALRRRAEGS